MALRIVKPILLGLIIYIVTLNEVKGFRSVRHVENMRSLSTSSFSLVRSPSSLKLNVLVDPSYDLSAGSAVLGTLCGIAENFKGKLAKVWGAASIVLVLFGGFVGYQTTTLRFQFDDDSFSLVKADSSSIGENVVVGGENDWKYSTFKNYDFWPSTKFPILVYFKEDQTPADARVEAPEIVQDGIEAAQAHYFPAIAKTDQLIGLFEKYHCKHI